MRPRKLRNLNTRRNNCESLRIPYEIPSFDLRNINDTRNYFDFEEIFGNSNPVYLEIGCGKGTFATEYAKRNPDINIIGVECVKDVLVQACEKTMEQGVSNIRYLEMKAEYLPIFIKEKSIGRIFLNFSTPYPKKSHAKHRLTSPDFLSVYKKLLSDGGVIEQKTVSKILFESSLENLSQNGFILQNVSLDLHNSDFEGNIVTEYESKFVEQGLPIYRLEAKLK